MSWVDLAGLALILWGAARGYLKGAWLTVLQLVLLVLALPVAYRFSQPVAQFINDQWPLESILVGWLGRGQSIETAGGSFSALSLPPLAGKFLLRLLPPQYALPVTSSGTAIQVTAAIFLRFLVLVAVFFFLVILSRYCLDLYTLKLNGQSEIKSQHYLGFFCGALYGFILALLLCFVLDSLSLFFTAGFWQADLTHSYLVRAADFVLQYF
ncbi:MAG: hypothetical protein GX197_02320 [Firmicutes bacterium]|nr:hypothetical protein [Bacillota bacterium]